jgi:hypothetical protein
MVMEVLYLCIICTKDIGFIRHSFGLTLCFGQEEWDNQHALDLLMLNLDLIRNSLSNNPGSWVNTTIYYQVNIRSRQDERKSQVEWEKSIKVSVLCKELRILRLILISTRA